MVLWFVTMRTVIRPLCRNVRCFSSSPWLPRKSLESVFYRRHCLANLAEKKRLLMLDDSPEVPKTIDFEESTAEWKYVERLIPPLTVPISTMKVEFPAPSGWQPPADTGLNLPYNVCRTRTQQPPVFLEARNGQTRLLTKVRYIEGDIWGLERDLRTYLEGLHQKRILTQVHEVANFIRFRGDYVNDVKQWLMSKGF